MQKRKLGQNGPLVSAIGMGAMNLSYGTGKATETQEAVNVLHAAIDQGINFFDTAEAYGPYTNETLLGKALWTREPEAEVLPLCESLGIGFVPWGPLGTGFLTGNIDENTTFDSETDLRAGFPRFTPEEMKANRPVVDMLKHVAAEKGASPVQIALAWLLAQKPWIVPIPGMDKKAYLSDNIKSADITLTSSDLAYIDDELARMTIQGARLNEDLLALSE